jgi:UDP-N-acetylmuramate--alanine ligase
MSVMTQKKKSLMQHKVKRIHFVGIGGIGMSGIAEVLVNLGYQVSGSDVQPSETTARLKKLGAKVVIGHAAENIGQADVVVTSSAVRKDNPEVVAARKKNIPVIPRAEMLAELLKMKFSVAVSGSHGKTTTTSMISTVLAEADLDPTMVIGGKLASIGGNARLGDGEIIVAEADESDGSFLKLSPTIAVITNIDREHLDYYAGIEDIKKAFLQFANIVPFYGCAVLCRDNEYVREILPAIHRRTITYGLEDPADYRAVDVRISEEKTTYAVMFKKQKLGDIELAVPGRFNVYNSLAAVAVGRELNLDFKTIQEGLKNFSGVQRRLEVKGRIGEITVVDDYGHHPTEIRETLGALRPRVQGRLIVVFQPHRYTRTKALFEEFTMAFDEADLLVLNDIYPASEEPIAGVDSARLGEAIQAKGKKNVTYLSGAEKIVDYLTAHVREKDTVLTLGAGNVYKIGEALIERLVAGRRT